MSNVLTGVGLVTQTEKASFRVPVAVDTNLRPTLSGADENGRPNYSPPQVILPAGPSLVAKAFSIPGGSDKSSRALPLLLTRWDDARIAALGQPGQKFVDNRGAVHTVQRLVFAPRKTGEPNVMILELEREISPEFEWDLKNPGLNTRPINFVYTPQVPAAVSVVTIQP
jgi:hypothetical protein